MFCGDRHPPFVSVNTCKTLFEKNHKCRRNGVYEIVLSQVHGMTPKMTLNTKRSKVPHMLYFHPRVTTFTQFRYTINHFHNDCNLSLSHWP